MPNIISREECAHNVYLYNVAIFLNSVIQLWDANCKVSRADIEFHLLDENFQGIWTDVALCGKLICNYDIECIVTYNQLILVIGNI